MNQASYIIDVNEQNFAQQVIEASQQQPVLVDFWATWCGPCQTLVPLLEKLANDYQGGFILAKVDVDQNQALAGHFGIRSVPTVKIVKDGQIVDEFMGVLPEADIRAKLDAHIVKQTDNKIDAALALHQQGETQQALDIMQQLILDEPENTQARISFAQLLVDGNRNDDAKQLLASLPEEIKNSPDIKAMLARMELADTLKDIPEQAALEQRIASNDADCEARYLLSKRLTAMGEYQAAMDQLIAIIQRDREYGDDAGRKGLLQLFELLGNQGDLVSKYRRKLASMLN